MTPQEAIKWLIGIEEKYIHGGDEGFDENRKVAIKTAISALEKQIEIENAQFTHICKSDKELYPTAFSIYARVVEENEESVTIDRFLKFGCLPMNRITISKEDFARYYKKIKNADIRLG